MIMVTAKSTLEDKVEGFSAGVDNWSSLRAGRVGAALPRPVASHTASALRRHIHELRRQLVQGSEAPLLQSISGVGNVLRRAGVT